MWTKVFFLLIGFIAGIGISFLYFLSVRNSQTIQSVKGVVNTIIEKPLEKYTIEALSQKQFEPSQIEIGEVLDEEEKFTSYLFYYFVDGKKVSGLLNIPIEPGNYPIIVMFRGYAPQETYTTGTGTRRGAEYFASNGFVTISPDFLGYGESDNPSIDIFEARFQTYTSALALLSSLESLNNELSEQAINTTIQTDKVGIWGHSNGGQIALTVLEITQKQYPTVLWAPVSKPFPYSILYYTDEADDYGRAMRQKLSEFEKIYDADFFNLTKYLDNVSAPIQLHQGNADTEVPVEWSDELTEQLEELDREIEYFVYPGADHNLMPAGWNPAIVRAVEFYTAHFAK